MHMDKQVLIEYADLKGEIKDIRRRKDACARSLEKLEESTVIDTVACGKKGKKPIRTVKVEGKPVKSITSKKASLKRYMQQLEVHEEKLLELQTQVEEYIERIEKSEIRMIFRLYYIDDLSWQQVAFHMNRIYPKKRRSYTDDSCRMKHNRFLEKEDSK